MFNKFTIWLQLKITVVFLPRTWYIFFALTEAEKSRASDFGFDKNSLVVNDISHNFYF